MLPAAMSPPLSKMVSAPERKAWTETLSELSAVGPSRFAVAVPMFLIV